MSLSLDSQLDAIRLKIEAKTTNTNAGNSGRNIADNTVTKSHALSRAYYRFGLVEKRCMEGLISKLHPLRSDNQHQDIELSALEYSKAYGVSVKIAYRDLSNAVDALMHRVITTDRAENKKGKKAFTLMSAAEYKVDEGKICCEFNYHVVPHLIGMRERFSSYPLRESAEFSSSYTWRFYEILASWSQPETNTKGRFMGWIDRQNVEELRDMMGVPKSYTWQKFQTRVMETAQKELWEKSNISVTFERVKTGRKITHLNIKFIEDDQQKLPLGCAGSK